MEFCLIWRLRSILDVVVAVDVVDVAVVVGFKDFLQFSWRTIYLYYSKEVLLVLFF